MVTDIWPFEAPNFFAGTFQAYVICSEEMRPNIMGFTWYSIYFRVLKFPLISPDLFCIPPKLGRLIAMTRREDEIYDERELLQSAVSVEQWFT